MKAYQVTDVYRESECAFVVFAEKASKARSIGQYLFDIYRYIDIEVRRLPLLDKFYKGNEEIDYENPNVKKILVEEYGWSYGEEE